MAGSHRAAAGPVAELKPASAVNAGASPAQLRFAASAKIARADPVLQPALNALAARGCTDPVAALAVGGGNESVLEAACAACRGKPSALEALGTFAWCVHRGDTLAKAAPLVESGVPIRRVREVIALCRDRDLPDVRLLASSMRSVGISEDDWPDGWGYFCPATLLKGPCNWPTRRVCDALQAVHALGFRRRNLLRAAHLLLKGFSAERLRTCREET
ncbi:MAG: hypothetical protein HY543_03335, partial [Deltaproteobacteria bacterium]|nr:hypothetical protein [Deltaproteobacteria bacterium]